MNCSYEFNDIQITTNSLLLSPLWNNLRFRNDKTKACSESPNCDIADNLFKEMLSLNEDMKDFDNSELRKETDIIYFWRSSKLSERSIAAEFGETTNHANKVIKKYKINVRMLLQAHKVKANKSRTEIKEEEIKRIKMYFKANVNTLISLQNMINNTWPSSDFIDPLANSTLWNYL